MVNIPNHQITVSYIFFDKCSALAEMGNRLAAIDMDRKEGGAVPLSGEGRIPIKHSVAWAKIYRHTKWHLDPSSRLATTDMGRKSGCAPLAGAVLGPHLTHVARVETCLHAKWHLDPSTTDMGRKLRDCCAPPPLLGWGDWVPI